MFFKDYLCIKLFLTVLVYNEIKNLKLLPTKNISLIVEFTNVHILCKSLIFVDDI